MTDHETGFRATVEALREHYGPPEAPPSFRRSVRLTPTEFKLLAALVRHAGKVVTHRQLLIEVWGPGAAANTHYLRVQMHGLRHKLEPVPARPRHLVTEPGVGDRFREEE